MDFPDAEIKFSDTGIKFLDAEFHRKEINDKIMTILKILLKKNSVISSEQNETSENSQQLSRAAS